MNEVLVVGDESFGGTYVLRVRVEWPLQVCFGRFNGGEPILVPPGELLYLGSALRGLASRVLRHALRTGDKPAHDLYAPLLKTLRDVGLVKDDFRPPTQKKLHWHIDYLLDETAVSLTHAILIRSNKRLEGDIGAWLLAQPETKVIFAGLGASDIKGHTHLMRIAENSGRFWDRLWDVYLLD